MGPSTHPLLIALAALSCLAAAWVAVWAATYDWED